MLTVIAPLVLGALVISIGGMVYGGLHHPGDPRDRIAIRVMALLISASWLASGALVIHAL